jgi:hypothetical protein
LLAADVGSIPSPGSIFYLALLGMRGDGNPMRTFRVLVEELAQWFGDAPALMSDAETLTFSTPPEYTAILTGIGARRRRRAAQYASRRSLPLP